MDNQPVSNPQAPMQQPAASPAQPAKKKNLQAFFLLLLLLLLIGGGLWFIFGYNKPIGDLLNTTPSVTPTPDPTTTWKPYINTTMGFSLRTPPQWTAQKEIETEFYLPGKTQYVVELFDTDVEPSQASLSGQQASLTIQRYPNSNLTVAQEAQNFIKIFKEKIPPDQLKYTTVQKEMNGHEAMQLNFNNSRYIFTTNGAFTYLLIFAASEQNFKEFTPTFDHIADSFTFLQSFSPSPTDGLTACTMEAKQCPDGSFVGREGPNCEFAKCPGE